MGWGYTDHTGHLDSSVTTDGIRMSKMYAAVFFGSIVSAASIITPLAAHHA